MDYFQSFLTVDAGTGGRRGKMQENTTNVMERVTVRQAAAELNMDMETLHYMMQKERLPIGYAIKREGKKRAVYIIYRGMLDQYKKQIAGGGE